MDQVLSYILSPSWIRSEISRLEKDKSAIEVGLKLCGRMTVCPVEEEALELCEGVINLARFLNESLRKIKSEIEVHQNKAVLLELNEKVEKGTMSPMERDVRVSEYNSFAKEIRATATA